VTLRRQVLFWFAALASLIAVLYVFREILLPFVAGMALAYLLDPLADRLERVGFNRMWATITILGLFTVVFGIFLILLMPVLSHQLLNFIERLPAFVESLQGMFSDRLRNLISGIFGLPSDVLRGSVGNLVGQGAKWLGTLLGSLWSGGQALLNLAALFVVTPVVAFYILYDWDRMVAKVDSWLPRDHADTVRALAREMDQGVAGFVRGQVSVCLILGVFYAVGLSAIGLNFGLLIGLGAGLVSFIPYVGATLGLILSVGIAVVQFWPEFTWIAMTLAVFVVGQFFEGNILQPKLVGASVGLHPVWLMFALFAFGYLFGFVGLLIAVPAAAAVGVLARFALQQYLESAFYRGTRADQPTDPTP